MQNKLQTFKVPEFDSIDQQIEFDTCAYIDISASKIFSRAFGMLVENLQPLYNAQNILSIPGKTVCLTALQDPVTVFLIQHGLWPCKDTKQLNGDLKQLLENSTGKSLGPGYIVEKFAEFCNIPLCEIKKLPPQTQIDKVIEIVNQSNMLLIAIEEMPAESLFMLAYLCGKDAVPVIEFTPDTPYTMLDDEVLKQLEQQIAPSVMLYKAMKRSLQNQLNPLFCKTPKLNISIAQYKKQQQPDNLNSPTKNTIKKQLKHPDYSNIPKFTIPEFANIEPKINSPQIFTHPNATGATSIHDLCRKILAPQQIFHPPGGGFHTGYDAFAALDCEQKAQLKFIFGHRNLGVHLQMPVKCEYVTTLRDPVTLFISNYFYAWRMAVTTGKESQITEFDTFEKWVDYNLSQRSSSEPCGYIPAGFAQFEEPWIKATDIINLKTLSSDQVYKMTCDNLNMHYMVGITEMFEETLFMLAWFNGWTQIPFWKRRNQTTNRPDKTTLPELMVRKIERIQGLSVRIYNEYKNAFEVKFKQLCLQMPGLDESLHHYKGEVKNSQT